jgi:hypothetical protein
MHRPKRLACEKWNVFGTTQRANESRPKKSKAIQSTHIPSSGHALCMAEQEAAKLWSVTYLQ